MLEECYRSGAESCGWGMSKGPRTTESFHPAIIPWRDRPNHFMRVLKYIPPKGERFTNTSVNVPHLTRDQINKSIKSLIRSGYIQAHRMGILERVLDTPENSP